ncbi:MAG: hypothetical protein DI536_08915 [Archangium gephyra]|uniref:Uncharacterized protein n=1 Tax=Archangium gephyra TaxID=48 RepID=A0A2W5TQM8_9BACT|nr:MAG: hypothetical protein DI536_08915 [Archangium gephyra]
MRTELQARVSMWINASLDVELAPLDGGTSLTLTQRGFVGSEREQADAAIESTSGFTIVLCDLKTLLETGRSAGLTKSKAKLISASL